MTEDDVAAADRLSDMINGWAEARGLHVSITRFERAGDLLSRPATFDIVFMDIGLPDMSGMDAARALRERDARAVMIFCTTMAQFAVEGYSVNAFDYLVKPVDRASLEITLDGACRLLTREGREDVAVRTSDGIVRLPVADITYVEIFDHRLVWHTDDREIKGWGSLKKLAEELAGKGFALCNSCYLVNLRRVRGVDGDYVTVGDTSLHCSRTGRKNLMNALVSFMS